MKQFKDFLLERLKIKSNKGFTIFFNQSDNHMLKDKLIRAKITIDHFTSSLNKVTKKIKELKLSSGNYSFSLTDFKLPVIYNKEKKEIFISTILTKDMFIKKADKKIFIESIEYQIIEVNDD